MPGTRFRPGLRLAALTGFASLSLTACGDGWVVQPYHGVPYDGKGIESDERTAGYGVEYVRANMMPGKSVNTTAQEAPPAPPAPAPQPPARDAAPLFDKLQSK